MRIHVKGLSPEASAEDLSVPLALVGITVKSVEIARDAVTGGCRGFGWAEIEGDRRQVIERLTEASPRLSFSPAR